MAGIGANTALRDAALLADRLIEAAEGGKSIASAIGAYESEMRAYANPAVALSRLNAERAVNGGALSRHLFRGFLRTVEAVPALKRKMFADPPRSTTVEGAGPTEPPGAVHDTDRGRGPALRSIQRAGHARRQVAVVGRAVEGAGAQVGEHAADAGQRRARIWVAGSHSRERSRAREHWK